MRTSQFLLATTKETPKDAQIISHQLMLKAGLIRKVASGLYNWLPIGNRILQKVQKIIREEMDKSGALEILMPIVQPATLWKESGRYDLYGAELLRFNDRHNRDFVLGPTHEEIITDIARKEIKSYKQLPLNIYQIQTKFRDEIRPRFGIMRSREFIMKDAYSFHFDKKSLDETYEVMFQTYSNIFKKCGLDFRPVVADSGSIGGSKSHEFHVIADSGEDTIVFSDKSDYAANIELAPILKTNKVAKNPTQEKQIIDTPNAISIKEVANLLKIKQKKIIKTLIIKDATNKVFAVILRGDHQLNEIKLNKLDCITEPFEFADDETISKHTCTKKGSIGPVGLNIPLIADHSVFTMSDFSCGANLDDQHFIGVNWGRDCELSETYDIRNAVAGDNSPDKNGKLKIAKGIEVGHIFQLGDKYSKALNAEVLDENGENKTMIMGCYGIGVTRVVAATIEQNYDDKGIVWPEVLAPFSVAIVPINFHKSDKVKRITEDLYQQLSADGVEVLLDDRSERPGVMFADMELIGIPHRITIGERSLKNNEVEYQHRKSGVSENINLSEILEIVGTKIRH